MTTLRALFVLLLSATPALSADALDDYVATQMRQLRLPGLALAVVREGRVETVRTYGSADVERAVPVTRDTLFEIGSVTKGFTALAVLMLAEEGRLRLDESIATFLPEAPAGWRPVTVRHLLTHSSGLQEYLSVPGLPDEAHARTHREMTALFMARIKQEFSPGETWAYSNTGYLLLGDIIERVTGESYWAFLRRRVLRPAGMHATRSTGEADGAGPRAKGYSLKDGALERRAPLSENAYAAGAIASTIDDMARWALALQAGRLVSAATREQMWTPLTVSRGPVPPFSYGFGWVVDRERGHRAVLHSGGTPGFSSAIRLYPEDGVAVVVLANGSDRILDHLPREIAAQVFPQLGRREQADPDPSRTARLMAALRGVLAGKPELGGFTPAMRAFLATASGRGMGEWIASHGELKALRYVRSDVSDGLTTLRYRATLGEASLEFSFSVTPQNELAQIYWW